jgi:CRP-like cAMP-binding protein
MAVDAELWRIPLFAALEPVALQELVLGATTRALAPGELLFSRGEAAQGGFVLTTGAIVLETREQGGGPEKIVKPVTLIGEIALIAPTARPTFARAREDSTLLEIPRALFRETLESHPKTAGRVRALFKERLAQLAKSLNSPAD